MRKVFNRGFTKGFLFNNSLELAKKIPGNQGVKIGKMVEYSQEKTSSNSIRRRTLSRRSYLFS